MASLLERIQNIGAGGAQPQQRGVESLLKAKTGRAGAAAGPKISTVGEQAAIGAGKNALQQQSLAQRLQELKGRGQEQVLTQQQQQKEQQVRQQEQMQQQQLAAQAQAKRAELQAGEEEGLLRRKQKEKSTIRNINNAAEAKLRDLAATRSLELDRIFADFEFQNAELEDRRDAMELEKRAAWLALQDKQYLEKLDRIGTERNLQNDIRWREETTDIILGKDFHEFLKDINFNTRLDIDKRRQLDELGKIDIDAAIQMAQIALQQEQEQAKWEAIGEIGVSGAQWAMSGEKPAKGETGGK